MIDYDPVPADITAALYALGVEGAITVSGFGNGIYSVSVDGRPFGLWDRQRQTFVD